MTAAARFPLPDEQPVAVNALRNKRSALMGELAMHQEQCDRIRSEIIHLDVVLRMDQGMSATRRADDPSQYVD